MKTPLEIAETALAPFINNTIEIKNQWAKPEVIEKVKLPGFRREFLVNQLAKIIKNKQRRSERIYIGQIGADWMSARILIERINKVCTDNNIDAGELRVDQDEDERDYLILSFNSEYTPVKIDVLAKGMYEREVNEYRKDYETMLRVMNTKECA